jgi:phthiocerol/phenolphthiocerol synthesis type-I polyketide synthase E
VLVIGADSADEAAMAEVVAQARERFGGIHGVVHAAGVLDTSAWRPLRELSREECDRQLRPKVEGLEVLARVLEGQEPDFVLLMSSLSAALGGVGYGAYAAANQYMDAFVDAQHRRGQRHWISVNWDAWASEDEPAAGGPGSQLARLAMEPAEATLALDRVLQSRRTPQVLVSTADLSARLSRAVVPAAAPVAAEAGATRHTRPDLHSVYVAPEGRVEKRLATIWCDTLGIERVGLDDNFFELGGTSLLAIRMVARTGDAFGIELPTASVFEGPTVRSMGRLVEAKAGPEGALASIGPAEGSRE